jgi:FkbM family methyltransferase
LFPIVREARDAEPGEPVASSAVTSPTSRRLTGSAHALVGAILQGIERLGARRRARRILDAERLLSTRFQGAKLYYPSASIIGSALASGSGWEPTLATAIDLVLPADEPLLVAEVGSNIGASLAQMIAVRPEARYVCFEPADRFRDVLVRNVEENGWENVHVESLLVGSRAEKVQLFTNTSTASVASRHYGEHTFLEASTHPMTTLDAYFRDAERLDLLKSDTDGFDFDVLLGARAVLARLAPTLYFEFAPFLARRVGRDGAEVLAYLRGVGYERFLVFAQSGELLDLTDAAADLLGLADKHRYVDVLTAARLEHLAAFPDIASATAG